MNIEVGRLLSLLGYVEATERDRLPTMLDMADYRGFRRSGEEVIKLPGVLVNVRDGDDHLWSRSLQRSEVLLILSQADACSQSAIRLISPAIATA